MNFERQKFDDLCRSGDIFGPVDEAKIAEAEAELAVVFPTEYREILRNYGAVLARGIEVYGLPKLAGNGPPLWQNVVLVTKKLRSWKQSGTERHSFVPFCDDGTGIYFYLDTSASPSTRIYAIGPGVDRPLNFSLFSFLLELAEGRIVV